MLMTPAPVCFAIIVIEAGKTAVPTMIFSCPDAVGAIFVIIPLVIVVVSFVVVHSLVILGLQCCRSYDEGRSQQGRIAKKVDIYSHAGR